MDSSTQLAEYFDTIQKLLSADQSDEHLFGAIVNAPFHNKLHTTTLDLGIVVLLMVNKKTKNIDRVALSDTEPARWAVKMTPVPFKEIRIPVDDPDNIIAKAIKSGKHQKTSDWKYLFTPALAPEAARFNQAGAGIACSYVYPLLDARDGGALIFSFYQPMETINIRHQHFMSSYADIAAQALK